jgi:hypothetical protein
LNKQAAAAAPQRKEAKRQEIREEWKWRTNDSGRKGVDEKNLIAKASLMNSKRKQLKEEKEKR